MDRPSAGRDAGAQLPTRGTITVSGLINGHPFRATLAPDGKKSHWLKLNEKMRAAAGAMVGDAVTLEIRSVGKEPEPRARRIHDACEILAAGKRRVCCFDRSGFYSKAFSAPTAAEPPSA